MSPRPPIPTTPRTIGTTALVAFGLAIFLATGFERMLLLVFGSCLGLVLLLLNTRGGRWHGAAKVLTVVAGGTLCLAGVGATVVGGWLFAQGGFGLLAGFVVVPVGLMVTAVGWTLSKAGLHS